MSGEPALSAILEVMPSNLLSLEYEVLENGVRVGTLENSPLHLLEKGLVRAGGCKYSVLREGVFRSGYLLRAAEGAIRARAERVGLAGSAYLLRSDAPPILLRKKILALRETYLICDASGEQVGSIVRESLLSRRMAVELKEGSRSLPREIVLFMIWLALLIHRRDGAGSAG